MFVFFASDCVVYTFLQVHIQFWNMLAMCSVFLFFFVTIFIVSHVTVTETVSGSSELTPVNYVLVTAVNTRPSVYNYTATQLNALN